MNTRNAAPGGSTGEGAKGRLTTLAEKMSRLPESRRKAIDEQSEILIAEEMPLQAIRRARQMTQATVAEELGINQENVSRLERRSDFLISSLRNYLEAMGGELRLVVDFPNRPSIAIAGISDLESYASDPEFDEAPFDGAAVGSEPDWFYAENDKDIFHRDKTEPEAYFNAGLTYLSTAEYDKAVEAFTAAIESNPEFPEAYVDRALAYLEMGEREKAKNDIVAIKSMLITPS